MASGSRSSRRAKGASSNGDGEFRAGDLAGTRIVRGGTFHQKALRYAVIDGLAIFEGDIVLGAADQVLDESGVGEAAKPQAGIIITGQQFRWPDARVPYDIDPGLPNQQRVTDAIAHWEANTRISFVLRTAANAATFTDFVHFQPGGGCSSMVGRRRNQQNITLAAGCGFGSTVHEIGHAVGLWHEQSREDRDTFVRIETVNIDPNRLHNFDQHIADGDDVGPYDYGSIMHYPVTAFSINGKPTIVALQPVPAGVTLGQRTGLSTGDIAAVHEMYPGLPTLKEVPKDPFSDPTTVKEFNKDPITDPTAKEINKDPISDPTVKEFNKDPITDPTIKEFNKDPITDPTIKEFNKDPIADPQPTIKEVGSDPLPPGPTFVEVNPVPFQSAATSQMPFVMAAPSRASAAASSQIDALAIQVDQLAAAVAQAGHQYTQLLNAYAEAARALESLRSGQG